MEITIRVFRGRYGDPRKWNITQDISRGPHTLQSAGTTYYAGSRDKAIEKAEDLRAYWKEAGERVNPIIFGSDLVNREIGAI